jgi:hypothetical protein
MSLRELLEQDLQHTLEDASSFGWPITFITPSGTEIYMYGQTSDISQIIDPDTGVAISGRSAHVTARLSRFYDSGAGLPSGVVEQGKLSWLCRFNDINGITYTFKVSKSEPDRTIGIVTCMLEAYD